MPVPTALAALGNETNILIQLQSKSANKAISLGAGSKDTVTVWGRGIMKAHSPLGRTATGQLKQVPGQKHTYLFLGVSNTGLEGACGGKEHKFAWKYHSLAAAWKAPFSCCGKPSSSPEAPGASASARKERGRHKHYQGWLLGGLSLVKASFLTILQKF